MNETTKSPFDKEPAEGSRETVDKQLAQQEQKQKSSGSPVAGRDRDQSKHSEK
ncbi:MAG: hypothetical protein WA702_21240 [Bradyrhizobium sp.]|jgi:hypothetical protein|uniref:hypothetical protein n=1 Tax=Bradyrhizobium sp. TaxID=376 RepID=UPI003C7D0988